MTPEKLLEAIGNIDDAFIEESAIRRRKLFGGNWGLVASAACLCLVIGGVIFLHNLGWMPYFPSLTQPTEPPMPTATDPTETTAPTAPETQPPEETVPYNTLPAPELQMYNDLFGDMNSWYNAALCCKYASPEEISLLTLFYGGFEGESQEPTDEEWAQLKDLKGFNENLDLIRLPVRKMEAILTELFGITLADVNPEGFEGLTYLESTDCWYHMITGARYADFNAMDVKPTDTGTKVYYDGGYMGNMVVTVAPNGAEGYRILSNLPVEDEEQALIDELQALFSKEGSWYSLALTSIYNSPKDVGLVYFFYNGFEGALEEAAPEEEAQLKEISNYDGAHIIYRLHPSKMDEILTEYFGITLAEMNSVAFVGMEYLESTDCWYYYGGGTVGVPKFEIQSVSDLPEGRLQVNYSQNNLDDIPADYSLILQPWGDGYRILAHIPQG